VVGWEEDAGIKGAFIRVPWGNGIAIRAAFHDVAGSIEAEAAFGFHEFSGGVLVGSAMAIHAVFGKDGPELGAEIDGGGGGEDAGAEAGKEEEKEERLHGGNGEMGQWGMLQRRTLNVEVCPLALRKLDKYEKDGGWFGATRRLEGEPN